MQLTVDLNAPPHLLCHARNLLAQTIRELHPDYFPLDDALEGGPALPSHTAGVEGAVTSGTDAKTGAPLYGGEAEGGKAPEYQPSAATTPDARVDMTGVNFHVTYCAEAEEPFYSSGPRKGQWKKRRGVAEETYDDWHAAERKRASGSTVTVGADGRTTGPIDTASAFTGTTAKPGMFDAKVPTNAGELMTWVSEKQVAKALTQADIDWAYATARIAVVDLFPPNDPTTIGGRISTLYGLLASRGGA